MKCESFKLTKELLEEYMYNCLYQYGERISMRINKNDFLESYLYSWDMVFRNAECVTSSIKARVVPSKLILFLVVVQNLGIISLLIFGHANTRVFVFLSMISGNLLGFSVLYLISLNFKNTLKDIAFKKIKKGIRLENEIGEKVKELSLIQTIISTLNNNFFK